MALIEKEFIPPKKEQLSIRLDPTELLHRYCEFIASSQHYVIEQSLRYTFRKDKEFEGVAAKNRTTWVKGQEQSPSEARSQTDS